ncbi:MAG: hypothetical protein ACFB21_12140 [Opitutales bacterium]
MQNFFNVLPEGHRPIWRVAVGLMLMPAVGFACFVAGMIWAASRRAGGSEGVADYAGPAILSQYGLSVSMLLGFAGLVLFLGLLFVLRGKRQPGTLPNGSGHSGGDAQPAASERPGHE